MYPEKRHFGFLCLHAVNAFSVILHWCVHWLSRADESRPGFGCVPSGDDLNGLGGEGNALVCVLLPRRWWVCIIEASGGLPVLFNYFSFSSGNSKGSLAPSIPLLP